MQPIKTYNEFLFEKDNRHIIHLFDVDDSLLTSASKIGYRFSKNDPWKYLTTSEYAKYREKLINTPNIEFNFDDFEKEETMYFGILHSEPKLNVLKKLDTSVSRGYTIGILTARSKQDVLIKALKDFLLYRDQNGNLGPIPEEQFPTNCIIASGDPDTKRRLKIPSELTPEEVKAYIIENYFIKQLGYSFVIFHDDDQLNIDAVNKLNNPRIKAYLVKN